MTSKMHGGKRLGAGRPYGSRNKATEKQRAEIDKIAASGLTPLDYMLSVMRDETAPAERRDYMARAAAPYVHPRLAAIDNTHIGPDGGPVVHFHLSDKPMTEEEWEREGCGRE